MWPRATRRSVAGVGLIITEGAYPVHPSAGNSDRVPRPRSTITIDERFGEACLQGLEGFST